MGPKRFEAMPLLDCHADIGHATACPSGDSRFGILTASHKPMKHMLQQLEQEHNVQPQKRIGGAGRRKHAGSAGHPPFTTPLCLEESGLLACHIHLLEILFRHTQVDRAWNSTKTIGTCHILLSPFRVLPIFLEQVIATCSKTRQWPALHPRPHPVGRPGDDPDPDRLSVTTLHDHAKGWPGLCRRT